MNKLFALILTLILTTASAQAGTVLAPTTWGLTAYFSNIGYSGIPVTYVESSEDTPYARGLTGVSNDTGVFNASIKFATTGYTPGPDTIFLNALVYQTVPSIYDNGGIGAPTNTVNVYGYADTSTHISMADFYAGSYLGSFTIPSMGWFSVNVDSFVRAQMAAGTSVISLRMAPDLPTWNLGGYNQVNYWYACDPGTLISPLGLSASASDTLPTFSYLGAAYSAPEPASLTLLLLTLGLYGHRPHRQRNGSCAPTKPLSSAS